jgi:pullulanase
MNQLNAYGEGVGFFNDRFRDAIRGGTTDSKEKSDQGFVTGLYTDFNAEIANRNTPTNLNDQKLKLNILKDVVKIGLAGNLRDFVYKNFVGDEIKASQFIFRGVPTAYAATTDETNNYVSAHDGYSLWDAISAKAPFYTAGRVPELASTFEKQRMVHLSLGLTVLSQGVPFIEGGSEILRSKSGDVDGYDSGDWFNHISFDFNDNNWGKGLPPSFKNYNDWSFWSPRLADRLMKPTSNDIQNNLTLFKALMRVRKNSSLFKNKNSVEAMKVVNFIHSDLDETGIIGMQLKNESEELLLFFNVNNSQKYFQNSILSSGYKMHPEFNQNHDALLKKIRLNNNQILIPERSIVVLVPVKE